MEISTGLISSPFFSHPTHILTGSQSLLYLSLMYPPSSYLVCHFVTKLIGTSFIHLLYLNPSPLILAQPTPNCHCMHKSHSSRSGKGHQLFARSQSCISDMASL